MSSTFLKFTAIVAAVVWSSRPVVAGPEDIAKQMADANQASIGMVRFLSCSFSHEVISESQPGQAGAKWLHLVSGQYWRSPNRIRVRTLRPQQNCTDERLIRDGKCWALAKYSSIKSNGTYSLLNVVPHLYPLGYGDVWEYALFHHWDGPTPKMSGYAAILAKASRVHAAGRVNENGRDLIHVRLTANGDEYEFWFDPAVNYLIRKFSHTPTSEPSLKGDTRVDEVTQFVEPVRGVFFPTVIEHRPTRNGQLDAVIRTTLSDVKVNQDIPVATLRLPNIAGMKCSDMMRMTDYTVDADGNRVGPESPTKVTPGMPAPTPDEPSSVSRPPSRPPWPLWFWVLIVSGCTLVLAGIVWYVRRRNESSSTN